MDSNFANIPSLKALIFGCVSSQNRAKARGCAINATIKTSVAVSQWEIHLSGKYEMDNCGRNELREQRSNENRIHVKKHQFFYRDFNFLNL